MDEAERQAGLDLALARKAAGLYQFELAALLDPPVDLPVVTAWERGLARPTQTQLAQIEALFRGQRAKPKARSERKKVIARGPLRWNRSLGAEDYAQGLRDLQSELRIPTVAQLARLLKVPLKTVTAANREELPVHVKFVIAAVLKWEGKEGSLYGGLNATQRRKVDAIAKDSSRKALYAVAPVSNEVPAKTQRALERQPYQWQKAERARKRAAKGKVSKGRAKRAVLARKPAAR